ncbi:DUF2478 domain-containing protein [Pelagimonas varians]|uniref:3-dehydroquinate dehydratase n=1 Tax=Pelagimonas varians TaxID=696760 RepID=A0A238KYF0_9RHOB|nr:DUF2478 domain-containing protein [Pelagimonas varians]PYG27859.1 uncharacterized protein DUF2478 [Pelagimonas varians]SMX47747.1 hypothetical protein PEV8663_03633 [Pelagimonas varians]
MHIAYTMAPGRGYTDLLLARVAERLETQGYKCLGTVQTNTERGDGPCDMDVKVLPDGPVLRISQTLGPASRGCRLDAAALETSVGLVASTLDTSTDLVIINKFGKHEAEGCGFRDVIAQALSLDIPVLVGVNALNHEAFQTFCDGAATRLEPDITSLHTWFDNAQKAIVTPIKRPAVSETAA